MGDDEFTCNGEMYDVLRQVDSAGMRVIVAIADGTDTWWQMAIAKEQDRQSKRKTNNGPLHDLLAKIASCKALPIAVTDPFEASAVLLRMIPITIEPECSGYSIPVDRPPLTS